VFSTIRDNVGDEERQSESRPRSWRVKRSDNAPMAVSDGDEVGGTGIPPECANSVRNIHVIKSPGLRGSFRRSKDEESLTTLVLPILGSGRMMGIIVDPVRSSTTESSVSSSIPPCSSPDGTS
jgi:hypothetical protein